jgi:hypothetical protein
MAIENKVVSKEFVSDSWSGDCYNDFICDTDVPQGDLLQYCHDFKRAGRFLHQGNKRAF